MRAGDEHPSKHDRAAATPAPSIWEPPAFADGATPPVLQPEHFDDEPQEVVFIPCQPIQLGDAQAHVHLRYTDDDQLALLVYSSLDELVSIYGERQSWVTVPVETLPALARHTGADVVVYDAPLRQEGETPR